MFFFTFVLLFGQLLRSEATKESESEDYLGWIKKVIEDQSQFIAKTRRNIVSNVKSLVIIEPTERETQSADDAMNYLFSIGTSKLLDTLDKMEYFCRERTNFLVEMSAFVIRKYTFHLNIRIVMSMVLSRMLKKNDLYCADKTFKENFVKFTQLLTEINPKLNVIRFKFIDILVGIRKSKVGITKIGTLCCGYWRYRSETLDAINDNYAELKLFVADMMDSYFGGGLKYLCLTYQEHSYACSQNTTQPMAQIHERDSIIMNIIDAMSKISHIIF